MDYCASIGTLSLLAKLIGVQTVVYSDYNSVEVKAHNNHVWP